MIDQARFAKLHLIGIILITIMFLWATLPGQAHAQDYRTCALLLHPIDPRTQPPLGPNVKSGLDKNRSKLA